MAVLKVQENIKQADGTYATVHKETEASLVKFNDGETFQQKYDAGELTGPAGKNGTNGTNGTSAGFGTPTATINNSTGTPSVTVTASGSNTAKVFNFDFKNLKGATGSPGATGAQGPRGRGSARLVVGTSKSGWTAADCDYLCDGTDDQVEINAAINALPSGGGEVVILDGKYAITASIAIRKENVTLSGCGFGTLLDGETDINIFCIYASNCTVQNFRAKAYTVAKLVYIENTAQHCVIQNNYLDGTYIDEEDLITIYGNNNILVSNIITGSGNGITVGGTGNINANNVRA